QAIANGPTTGVPRQAFPYRHLTLASLTVPNFRSSGTVKKYLEKAADTVSKWDSSAWPRRRTLTDFERFQVLVHKKARRDKVRKVLKCTVRAMRWMDGT
ncbi:hypothetical protein EDB83DRAFT_2234002, partial [Lactarius deliciosus]